MQSKKFTKKRSKIHISSLDGGNVIIGSSSSTRFSIVEAEGGEDTSQKHPSVLETEQHTFSNLLTSALLQVIL